MHHFDQVDVFTDELLLGNPVAVVHDAHDLDDEQLAAVARWTNLSETTFLLPPTDPQADYRVRIFTTSAELPFAGHPTLGTARAWLEAGGVPRGDDVVVQECGAGLVRVRRDDDRLAFAAPPLRRSGPPTRRVRADVLGGLRVDPADVVDVAWADNGPGWLAVLLRDAAAVLALEPDLAGLGDTFVGVVGPYPAGDGPAVEVRAFAGGWEDPVTGSVNASIAQWLIGGGRLPDRYVAAQGTRLRRRGRVHVAREGADIWVGGHTVVGVRGELFL